MSQLLTYYEQPRCTTPLHCGVDYLTCTQLPGDLGKRLLEGGENAVATEYSRGNRVVESSWRGYKITRCGSAMYGERPDSVIAQVSGHAAAENWVHLLPHARNVTRLDLQVTAVYDPPQPLLAREAFDRVPKLPTDRGRPRTVRLVANSTGGDTFYFGSRRSDAFARFYDKGVEQKQAVAGKVWRWELELKRVPAKSTAVELLGAPKHYTYVASQVYSWFWRWGVMPGFPRRWRR